MNAEQRADKGAHEAEPVGELSYMAASRELDGIVEFFERSDVDVDELVTRLERATAIVDELDRRIRRTRAQVEELVPKLEAAGRTASSQRTVTGDDRADDDRAEDDGTREGESLPF
jgi:exonuclease VII small subunit